MTIFPKIFRDDEVKFGIVGTAQTRTNKVQNWTNITSSRINILRDYTRCGENSHKYFETFYSLFIEWEEVNGRIDGSLVLPDAFPLCKLQFSLRGEIRGRTVLSYQRPMRGSRRMKKVRKSARDGVWYQ